MTNTGEKMLRFLKNSLFMAEMAGRSDGREELRKWAEQLESVQAKNQQLADDAAEGLRLIRTALKEVSA